MTRPRRSSSARARTASSPAGGVSSIQQPRTAEASATSGVERCWARKMRKTASSIAGRALQVLDAVVLQHAQQPLAELVGQPAALDVEALQEGVEVLARAVHAQLGVPVLVDRPVAAQLGEVGEDRQQRQLVGDDGLAVGAHLVAHGEVLRQRRVLVLRRHVVAEHDRGQRRPGPRSAGLGVGALVGRGQVEGGTGVRDGLLGARRRAAPA